MSEEWETIIECSEKHFPKKKLDMKKDIGDAFKHNIPR